MTRFIGKKSNAPLYLTSFAVAIVASLVTMEYLGAIDIVPGFGREKLELRQYK